ncbi:hypothetical protein SCLCIDRAFT_31196 [Scleroderma citrinum Foug A]|uniref:DUF6830 domain-containing protein n=1 Tax=Scleroderma citrinum Foug A TaxID=1036808 RepID=A0A0C3DE07_9AGAM|nr:hypothetical protein SCLCIDRAFT_31196 [Scleroderma citrinum Foug A]
MTLQILYDLCASGLDPWHLQEFLATAKAAHLNGVQLPFWRDWQFSDPSIFLVGEILHALIKFFFDHAFKWFKELLGTDEMDMRYRMQHKHVGVHHFKKVSHMKQMTGRDHRDLARTIVATIAGVAEPTFICAIRALVDFMYQAQSPTFMESSICDMEKSLSEFHRYKHAILEAGARRGKSKEMDHFRIPKLELIQSFGRTIRNVGLLIQYTADVSERLLITHCKGPFSHTNCQKTQFTRQIVTLLDCEESSRLFNLYALLQDKRFSLMNMLSAEGNVPQHSDPTLDWVLHVSPTDKSRFKGPRVIRNLFSKGLVSDDATVVFHLTVKSDFADKSSNHLVTMYALPDFATHLQAYIMMTCDNASRFQARSLKGWLKFRIQQQSRLQPCNVMASQQIQALPPSDEHPFGKCDTLLVRSASDSESVDVVQVCAIFALSPRGSPLPVGLSTPLLYVQHFTFTGTPADHPDVGMFSLRRKFVSNPDSSLCRVSSIVLMLDVVHAVELIPKYGASARRDVTLETCLEVYDDFYLNNFSDKEWYYTMNHEFA